MVWFPDLFRPYRAERGVEGGFYLRWPCKPEAPLPPWIA